MPFIPDLDIVLNEVKKDVKARKGREANARVTLARFNPSVLGFVRAGDDTIYINEIPYSQFRYTQYEHDYLYVVILHEYLHLLGIAEEREVRRITMEIVEDKFGDGSFAYKFSIQLADPIDIYLKDSWRYGKPHTYI
ncbi:hypothetical protein [Acidianus sp. HS-5]|uniref:hypothetical protein n=1 Tax=Acidianus sp. HS-5 TaxID=2886040 RepID=UPI001F2DDEEF|nr:hypothetical protein [Acidianus sp. HS-5]BDC18610.1 hypothetical protein HS5_15000 [Acidianus sp. HS-5]